MSPSWCGTDLHFDQILGVICQIEGDGSMAFIQGFDLYDFILTYQ